MTNKMPVGAVATGDETDTADSAGSVQAPNASAAPILLVCAAAGDALPDLLRTRGASVVAADSGLQTLVRSLQVQPDVVVLDAGMPGLSPLDVCRVLHTDRIVPATVPTLVLVRERPTPEERVEAVQAGVWEFVSYAGPQDVEDLWPKLQTYAQAKRNIDEAISEGLADPMTGVLTGPGLVRRGREVLALMGRARAPVACLVFALPEGFEASSPGAVVAGASRLSDVVGALDARRFAVIAPSTDEAGAIRLADRIRLALRSAVRFRGEVVGEPVFRVGCYAVGNVGYRPMDAVELLRLTVAALERGTPDAMHPWMRRFGGAHV